jgi:8-oxo-dGTP pyrophosphatase MutT (NUDIX family)
MVARRSLVERLSASLLPAPETFPEGGGAPAGVLVPVIDAEAPSLVFTRRTESLRRHPGEISFPGGLPHPGDADLLATALRETEEEVGVPAATLEVVGTLPPISTFVSGILIVPFVGLLRSRPVFVPNPAEIAAVLEFPMAGLMDAEREVEWTRDGSTWRGYAYELDGHTVWGATGRIVHEFLEAVREPGD